MRRDLSIPASVYGLGAGIFFLGYFAFEVPASYVLAKIGARRWLAITMVAWGLISASMAFIKNGQELLVYRFLLGIAEAGFFPGALFFLMQIFPRRWHARVISYLIVIIPLSSAVSALISGFIFRLSGTWNLHGWQWIFLLEGLPSVVLGGLLFVVLPDAIEKAPWLTQAERKYLHDSRQAHSPPAGKQPSQAFRAVFMDLQIWKIASIFFCLSFVNGTINFFLPQMIAFAGVDKSHVMYLVPVPYSLGAICLILCAARSDISGRRRWNILVPMGVAVLGLVFVLPGESLALKGASITFAIAALFTVLGLMWVVPGQLLKGPGAATGIALINSIGNLGNFFGPSIFSALLQFTGKYNFGIAIDAAVVLTAMIAFYFSTKDYIK